MRALAALSLLLLASAAQAYEGASILREGEADAGTPLPAPQLTRAPELKRFVEATYPPEALASGAAAEVALQVDIDPQGKVAAAEVTRSAGPAFDQAALEAVRQFEFTPGEIDGQPALIRIEYVYHFEPRPPPAPVVEAPPPVNLRGRVLERGTRDPVAGAQLYLPEHQLNAETDAEGRFELRGVPAGKVRIEILGGKHKKFRTTEEVKAGEVTELTAYLHPKIEGAFETVVVGEREKKDVARRTLQKEELQSVPGTFGDPLRVLQNMPGMARAPYLSGALLVRGAQPEDSQVFIDGVPVPLLYHFAGGPSVIAPSFIDRIDFFPGAYGARYGRAIAGVVDVGTQPPAPKRLHGQADVDLLDAGFFLEAPLSEQHNLGSVALAARRSYIDVFLPAVMESVRQPGQAAVVAAPYYWDYQARYDLTLGQDRFELLSFGSNDLLKVSQVGESNAQSFSLDTHQGFHRVRLGWTRKQGDGWSFSLAPSLGMTLANFGLGDLLEGGLTSYDASLRGYARKELGETLTLEAGVDGVGSRQLIRFELAGLPTDTNPEPAPEVISSLVRMGSWAGYLEAVWSPLAGLKLIPGLRYEAYLLPGGLRHSVEPRAAARYQLLEGLEVKAAWGRYRQAPQPMELDARFGNPDLGLAQSEQTAAGFEWRFAPSLSLDLQGFYNWRSQLVVSSRERVIRDGEEVSEQYRNGGRGRAYGVELLLKHDLTERFYGWIAYTLSRSEQLDDETGRYEPVEFDQSHILTVVGSYKLEWGWELGARFRLTTGRPETPVIGSTFDADSGTYRAINGEPGSARGETFHQLDVRAEKLWTFETWKLAAYLDVQNLYNAENPELKLWDYRYRESASLRGLPLLPTLGIRGEF